MRIPAALLLLSLAGAATAAAPQAPPASAPPMVTIVGHVTVNSGVPLPGIAVQLGGAAQRTTVTDANGTFVFRVLPGSYVVSPPHGVAATFTPDTATLSNLTMDTVETFNCSGNCGGGPAIIAGKELVVTHPTVTSDPRASNAVAGAPWSFRFLVEQMTPAGVDPADFTAAWLSEFEVADGTVNGFPVDVRNTAALRALWPTTAGGKLDLSKAPFRLLAIINRTDLHAAGNGEARFVFGAVDAAGAGKPMTVIFEFELPAADPRTGAALTRRDWAARFHALGGLAFGPTYNASLQAVTDLFTRRNADPSRPGGSAIGQVRSNEIFMGGPWQMREFHLAARAGVLGLRLAPPAQTPVDSAVTEGTPQNQALLAYLAASRAGIVAGSAAVPEAIRGGQSNESFSWTFSAPVDAVARHAFAGQTCNGCHFSESGGLQINGFYHVTPVAEPGPDGSGRLSSFIKLVEIPRRTFFMQNVLTCSGWTCSAGAEPGLL